MAKMLNDLKPAPGSVRTNNRRGRGEGSGQGGTAGKGHKGQQSRSGYKRRAWFEGGQMPIQRRLPKRGFTNIFRQPYQIVNLSDIDGREGLVEVTPDSLVETGLIKKADLPVKVLGDGEISRKINVDVTAVSKSAREKIEAAGGTVKVPAPAPKRGKYKKKSERTAE